MRGRTKTRSLSASPALGSTKEFRRTRSLHGPCPVTTFGPKACMLQNPQAIIKGLRSRLALIKILSPKGHFKWDNKLFGSGKDYFGGCFLPLGSPRAPDFWERRMKIFQHLSNCSFGPSSWKWHIQDPASQRLTWNKAPKSVLVIKKIRDASLLQPFKDLCIYLTEVNSMLVYVEKKVLEDPAIVNDESFGSVKKRFCTFSEDYDDISDQIDFIICLGGDGTLLYASSLFPRSVPPVMAFHLGSLGFLTPFNFENVLNEVVVDRGPSSYLSNVDVFLDGHLITTVQGDGVIVSTPTGSTAYAAAAGASMIHPNVPAIMITPICPHSLSFRPIVVPAGVDLKIMLSPDARNTAWVSFDGRKRQEICHGDSISITTSCYPLPSICFQDPVSDWFESLAECLHWNVRKRQNHFAVDEEEEF
ncbi:NAD kinase [Protobothrops mucrosquamatus]|uniref:NAD kinase n=1 Tax=Protobothrops mucrosquamatus TaxID=103944 RepID=UPI0010FAE31D|nr:NAD kinase [Protobothrops mucrosquamatus]